MSLREPNIKRETNYAQLLLARLQRESTERGRRTVSFSDVCDMVAVPRDLRAALRRSLEGKGYVKQEGGDLVSITAAGTKLATSPFS